ncbi:hypothetical protein J4526_06845 [Desulfurococcaceae archaeon MEX13E-LK6-19]|nr:hypothetical protein J4526_06845 [Desulfurococcaceae archaeon MEX13E-LK6-19]
MKDKRKIKMEFSIPVTRKGKAAFIVTTIMVLYIIFYLSYGFIAIVSGFAEWWASLSISVKIGVVLIVVGLILMIIWSIWKIKTVTEVLKNPDLKPILATKPVHRVMVLVALGLIVAGLAFSIVAQLRTLDASPYEINIVRLDTPINTSTARLVPLHTAYAYAVSMLQTPTHTIYEEETYVYYLNGSIVYNWIIEPEGFWNAIKYSPQGVIFVNGSVYPPKVEIINRKLVWGLHNLQATPFYLNNLYREIKVRVGFDKRVLMDCNIEIMYNDKIYILVPIATWRVTMFTSVPVLYGYAVVSEDGNIEILNVDQARNDPRFKNIPLVPDVIAREWTEIYKWYTGVGEVILRHNTYEIRDVGRNPQPYLMVDEKGRPYWVFIVEPPGQTYAARYIFYVDASNPEPHIMIYTLPEPVMGISKVESIIKQAHPTYDWEQFEIAEPLPILINGKLYWKVTVITKDGRGLVSIDLVDTETNQVLSLTPTGKVTMTKVLTEFQIIEIPENVTKPPTTLQEIIERIEQIKQKIKEYQQELDQLYQELDQLQQILEEITTNETKT